MESWAVEVKPGETFKCDPQRDNYVYLYLTQASLGKSKKEGAENVQIFLKFGDQNLVIGTLSAEKWPQILYNLFFEKKFELSHNSKNASVFFFGQKTLPQDASDSDDDDDLSVDSASSDDNDVQVGQIANVMKHDTGEPKQEADEIVELEEPSYPKNLNANKESSKDDFEEYSSDEYSSEGDSHGEYDSEEDSHLTNDSEDEDEDEDEEEIDEDESSEEEEALTSMLDSRIKRIKRLSPREQSALYAAVVQNRGSPPSKTSKKAKRSNAK